MPARGRRARDFVLLDGAVGQVDAAGLGARAGAALPDRAGDAGLRRSELRASGRGVRRCRPATVPAVPPAVARRLPTGAIDAGLDHGGPGSTVTAGSARTCLSARRARPISCASRARRRVLREVDGRRAPAHSTRAAEQAADGADGRTRLRGCAGLGALRRRGPLKGSSSMAKTAQLGPAAGAAGAGAEARDGQRGARAARRRGAAAGRVVGGPGRRRSAPTTARATSFRSGASGDWQGMAGRIAVWSNGGWVYPRRRGPGGGPGTRAVAGP